MDLFSCLEEGERDGLFNFIESEKHLKKTRGGSFFVSLVPLGRKRDNLPLESTLLIKQLLERSFYVISLFGPKKEYTYTKQMPTQIL